MTTKAPWVSKTPGGHEGTEVKKDFGVQKGAGCPIRRRGLKTAPGGQESAVGEKGAG